jgi:transposase
MTDRPSDKKLLAKLFVDVYPKILSAERHQCKSFLEDELAKLNQQIAFTEVEAFENMGAEMFYKVNKKLRPSLDKLMQTIREWIKYEKFFASIPIIGRLYYANHVEDIEKCYFATSILRPITRYLEAVSFESNKSYFEKKVDDLNKGIDYLLSREILNALYVRFDNNAIKVLNKLIGNYKFKDKPISYSASFREAIDELRFSLQEASNDIEDIIKYLLKNPEENIKQVNKIIGIEEDYRDNKK